MTAVVGSRKGPLFYYLILTPALLVVLLLTVQPVFSVLANSLVRYSLLGGARAYVGLANLVQVAREPVFRRALLNTVIFAVSATVVETSAGVLLALLFHGRYPGKRAAMTTVMFPMLLSTMVICAVWKTMYHHEIGIINHLLSTVGLPRVGWLTNKNLALVSVLIVDVWQWAPFAFIVVQAGLNTVPRELFEAAAIDGAGRVATTVRVILPVLTNQIVVVFLLRTIDTFRVFDKVYALTQGGPGNATETVSYFIYREAFSFFNFGRASAAAVYTLLVVAVIASVYVRRMVKG